MDSNKSPDAKQSDMKSQQAKGNTATNAADSKPPQAAYMYSKTLSYAGGTAIVVDLVVLVLLTLFAYFTTLAGSPPLSHS